MIKSSKPRLKLWEKLFLLPYLVWTKIHWKIYQIKNRNNRTVQVTDAVQAILEINNLKIVEDILNEINSLYSPNLVTHNGKVDYPDVYLALKQLEKTGLITSVMVTTTSGNRLKGYSLIRENF